MLWLAIPIAFYWFYRIIAQHVYKNTDVALVKLSLSLGKDSRSDLKRATLWNVNVSKFDFMRTLKVGDGLRPKNLVFCHGFMSGLAVFHKTYAMLDHPDYNIYAFDWLGLGMSSRSQFPDFRSSDSVTKAEDYFVNALEAWRIEMKLEKMTVCAHSLGGYLISVYALRYPHRIEKLILVSPAGFGVEPSEKQNRPLSKAGKLLRRLYSLNITPPRIIRLLGPLGLLVINALARARFARLKPKEFTLLKSYLYGTCILPGTAEAAFPSLLHAETLGFIAKSPLPQRMKNLNIEILFIFGSNDWMDHTHALKCQDSLLKSQVVVMSDSTHHLYMDEPELFTRSLHHSLSGTNLKDDSLEYL